MINKKPDGQENAKAGKGPGLLWILVLVLVLGAGVFIALGRTQRDTSAAPPGATQGDIQLAEPDQVDNTVRAEGLERRDTPGLERHRPTMVREATPPGDTLPAGPDTREGTLE